MATISKEFLDSLPADERDEFLSSTLAMLSLNPPEQDDKIMGQKMRDIYKDHRGRIVECSFCRKDEPDDQEFGECTGCRLVLYCSKECQRSDWKQHKVECRKCDDEQTAALHKKVSWRLDQFYAFYSPFIHKLVLDMYRLFNKELDAGDVLFPADTFVDIHLADLPRSAKRPRYYIKEVRVAKMLGNKFQAMSARTKPLERGYAYVHACLTYKYGREHESISSYSQFQYHVSSAELRRIKRSTKEAYAEKVGEHVNYINDIAKGENPRHYKIIKEILKEKLG